MSFLHAIESFGKWVLVAAGIAAPIVSTIDPPVGLLLNAVLAFIAAAEQAVQGEKQGPVRKALVLTNVEAGVLPLYYVAYPQSKITAEQMMQVVSVQIDKIVAAANGLSNVVSDADKVLSV